MLKKDGELLYTLDRGIITERDDEGNAIRVNGLITNITEIRLNQERLINVNRQLSESGLLHF